MKNQLQRINEYIDSLEEADRLPASNEMMVFCGSRGKDSEIKSNGGNCSNSDATCMWSYNGGDCSNARLMCGNSTNVGHCKTPGSGMLSDQGCSVGPEG